MKERELGIGVRDHDHDHDYDSTEGEIATKSTKATKDAKGWRRHFFVGAALPRDCSETVSWDRGVKPLLQLETNTPEPISASLILCSLRELCENYILIRTHLSWRSLLTCVALRSTV